MALNSTLALLAGLNASTCTLQVNEEEVTLSTSGTTTDSTSNLIPANSLTIGFTALVTTTITTATDWRVKNKTSAINLQDAAVATMTAGTASTNGIGNGTVGFQDKFNVAAGKCTITTTGTPGAGKIRLTVYSLVLGASTT